MIQLILWITNDTPENIILMSDHLERDSLYHFFVTFVCIVVNIKLKIKILSIPNQHLYKTKNEILKFTNPNFELIQL